MKYLGLATLFVSIIFSLQVRALSQELDEGDFLSTVATVLKISEDNSYQSNFALRETRRIGLGLGVGGTFGRYGLNIEVNFEDQNAGFAGFGGGTNYNTFNIGWKHIFEGDTIAPYTSAGYSRWYNVGSDGDYRNSPILDRVLSSHQKAEDRFSTDFLSGAVGLQYLHLQGPMAGTSLYAEVILLGEVNNSTLVPTGSVGASYYF